MLVSAFAAPCAATLVRGVKSWSPQQVRHHATSRRSSRVHVIRCVEVPTNKPLPEESTSTTGIATPSALSEIVTPPRSKSSERGSDNIARDVRATLSWIAVAAGVAGATMWGKGWDSGVEFITAYIVEYSLSVDNLFVFLLIFNYFKVGREAQSRVLTYGIAGAMVMRGVLIFVGEALTQRFSAVTVAFAALLLFSAGKLLLGGEEDEDEDLEKNGIVKFSRTLLPFTDKYDGDRFFTMENGIKLATPLMLVLLSVEFSDIVFALDSVPAVLGISNDSLVIYSSNILAIMGLRNLFFVLSDIIGDLRFLQKSLAIVLGFVGSKMIAGVAGYSIDVLPSLAVVVGTLVSGVGLSVAFPEEEEEAEKVPAE